MDIFSSLFHHQQILSPRTDTAEVPYDLQSLIAALPGMVFRSHFDLRWKLEFISDGCFPLTGYTPDELLNNNGYLLERLIHPDDQPTIQASRWSAAKHGSPYEVSYRLLPRAGGEKLVRESGRCQFEKRSTSAIVSGFIVEIPSAVSSPSPAFLQDSRLISLHKIDLAIISSTDLLGMLNVVIDQVLEHFDVKAAGIALSYSSSNLLVPAISRGILPDASGRLRFGADFAARVAQAGHKLSLNEFASESEQPVSLDYLGLPIFANHELKGILEIFNDRPLELSCEDITYLEIIASQAAVGITVATLAHKTRIRDKERSVVSGAVLEGWSKTLELRDLETKGHTQRVAQITIRLAEQLGVSEAEQVIIFRGALLHDIGKMGIPDSILQKPGPLDPEEQRIVRHHPELAYQLLSSIPGLSKSLDIPYCHHERWDGNGYPRGLKGKEIPLAARIFTIIDVWDALTSDRPYRKALPTDEALQYIRDESGHHFDPEVVQAFLAMQNLGQLLNLHPPE